MLTKDQKQELDRLSRIPNYQRTSNEQERWSELTRIELKKAPPQSEKTELTFVEHLPDTIITSAHSNEHWTKIARTLRTYPNWWAIVMTTSNRSKALRAAQQIRRGAYKAFRNGEFEAYAAAESEVFNVYARFIIQEEA